MKRLLFLLTILMLVLLFPLHIRAQDIPSSSSATPLQVDDYTLPYPGLLPDNPLYVIKSMRDEVIGLLISDPVKKAEYDVLQSDKRMQASVLLLQKDPHKEELALSTLTSGEAYFGDSIEELQQAKHGGRVVSDLQGKLLRASQKHIDVLTQLQEAASAHHAEWKTLMKKAQEYHNMVK